jgi:hypothetical protein
MCVEQLHTWVLAMKGALHDEYSQYSQELLKWASSNWPNICFDRPRQLRGSRTTADNSTQPTRY